MIPVYCIGEEVEREEAWRRVADGAFTGEELVPLAQAIRQGDEVVALLRRPAINDNRPGPHRIKTSRRRSGAFGQRRPVSAAVSQGQVYPAASGRQRAPVGSSRAPRASRRT